MKRKKDGRDKGRNESEHNFGSECGRSCRKAGSASRGNNPGK